jgi:hypothetical protein
MSRERAGEKKNLRHEIKTRVNDQKFGELNDLLSKTRCHTMSELVRNILYNRPVKVFTVDETFHQQMEELSAIRKELKAIGININQITRYFNSATDATQKLIHSFKVDKHILEVGDKVERLLEIVSKLSEKWLQE